MSRPFSTRFSDRKISETLLDFAEPLLECLKGHPTPEAVQGALQIAWTVWNAVVFEQTSGNGTYLAEIRERMSNGPTPYPFPFPIHETLIDRKRATPRFASDHRMMGEFSLILRDGGWALRLEAHAPPEPRDSAS